MAGVDLTTLAAVKAWLGLDQQDQTEDDPLLSGLITAASAFIRSWCGRALTVQDFTELRDGNGSARMRLRQTPIAAVTNVMIGGLVVPPGDANATPGYYFSETMLCLNGYRFQRGAANVTVIYTAGFATIPDDLAQACTELVGRRFREKDRIGLVSKGMAGETTQFSQGDLSAFVRTTLENYRKVVPV